MKGDKYYTELEEKGYYETIDKRSKEYREYKEWKSYKSLKENIDTKSTVGLGDVVEAITKATGIKKVVEAMTDDCGCDERKEKLNKIPLFKRSKVNCIEEEDYVWVKELLRKRPSSFTFEIRERVVGIYNFVFNSRVKNTKCYSCIRGYLDNLQKYLDIYES